MALVRASCSDCGDVELRSRNILIRTCEDTGNSSYIFRCPVCRMMEARPAGLHTVDVLLAAGCNRQIWRLPSELEDPRRTDGFRLTHDYLLDFHDFVTSAYTPRIIKAALPMSLEDQQRFVAELQRADSDTIARELNS